MPNKFWIVVSLILVLRIIAVVPESFGDASDDLSALTPEQRQQLINDAIRKKYGLGPTQPSVNIVQQTTPPQSAPAQSPQVNINPQDPLGIRDPLGLNITSSVDFKTFATLIKKKYPQYDGIDDLRLTHAILNKFDIYKSVVTFPFVGKQ